MNLTTQNVTTWNSNQLVSLHRFLVVNMLRFFQPMLIDPCELDPENCRDPYMQRTVGDSVGEDIGNEELRNIVEYGANRFTFGQLYADSSLIATGAPDDPEFIAYFDSIYNANLGLVKQYFNAIEDSNYIEAEELLSELSTSNIRELNQKTALQIYQQHIVSGLDTLTPAETNALLAIATQHSFIGGEGVFLARALLDMVVEEPLLSAERWEEYGFSEMNDKINLAPNPTNGAFTISTNVELTRVDVIDITGRILKTYQMSDNKRTLEIDLTGYANGIYFVNCIDNEKLIQSEKVVLAE